MRRYRRTSFSLQAVFSVKTLPHRLSIFFLISLAIFIIVVGRVNNDFTMKVRTSLMDFVTPIIDTISRPIDYAIDIKRSVGNFFDVYNENKKLRIENDKLKRVQAYAGQLVVENKQLKNFLNFAPEPGVSYISGRIAGETGGPYIRSAIISIGTESGVKKGQIVVNEEGVVGRIIEAGENSARIMLITDINSRVPVVTGQSKELGMVSGTNSSMLKMLYVPEGTKMQEGEEIFTSGDGEFFPSGLLIGYVHSISQNSVIIKPAVNWSKVEFISVVDYSSKQKAP